MSSETMSAGKSIRKRSIIPFRYAWRSVAKFLGVGGVAFGIVALAVTNLPILGYIAAGLITLGLLVLFVQHCTPSS